MDKPDTFSLRFGWIIAGTLAGSARPWPEALSWLRERGVRAIVSATERALDFVNGFDYLHLPVIDQHAPTFEQMDAFTAFVEARAGVLVHCAHGVGRTATFAASYIIHAKHRTADQARELPVDQDPLVRASVHGGSVAAVEGRERGAAPWSRARAAARILALSRDEPRPRTGPAP